GACGRARDEWRGLCVRPSSSYARENRALARDDASSAGMCASRSSPFSPENDVVNEIVIRVCVLRSVYMPHRVCARYSVARSFRAVLLFVGFQENGSGSRLPLVW